MSGIEFYSAERLLFHSALPNIFQEKQNCARGIFGRTNPQTENVTIRKSPFLVLSALRALATI